MRLIVHVVFVDFLPRLGWRLLARVSADGFKQHALPVHRDFELVRALEADKAVGVRAQEGDLEGVFAVEGEHVGHAQATKRSKRQALDVLVLRPVLPDEIRLRAGADARLAHGERADALSRRDIAFDEHRRQSEHVGHVVEAEGGIIGRQEPRDVDLHIQQIANRVGVFSPVQAMDERLAGIGMDGRGAIELRLEPGGQALDARLVPADAWRGHRASAQLANDFFPEFTVGCNGRKVLALEHQPGGFQTGAVAGFTGPFDHLTRGDRGGAR